MLSMKETFACFTYVSKSKSMFEVHTFFFAVIHCKLLLILSIVTATTHSRILRSWTSSGGERSLEAFWNFTDSILYGTTDNGTVPTTTRNSSGGGVLLRRL